jgi:alkanesulfonate monooxygenase SsuD/methylene tetrahydromethanopterin reductase-like flavin-dependent oxidoreductase (luciferase family)
VKVHMTNLIQNYNNADSDYDIYKDQIALSLRADQDGYESIGCVEHHFDPGYSMCPDNTQFLSYLAGRTTRAKMHTTAVILPWNDPMRVVEKISLLDNLSDGRAMFGMGRGLARREFEGFGIEMGESRERFDEAAELIIRGLEDGFVEGTGKYYPQVKVPVHPAPLGTFKGRTTCVAMSPDSAVAAGKLGVQMMAFIQGPMETMHLPMIEQYRAAYRDSQGEDAPPPLMIDLTYCHRDSDEARRVAYEHVGNYYMTCVEHYEFGGRHFESTSGYASYAAAKQAIDEYGLDTVIDIYVNGQIWGTPAEQIAKHEERQAIVGVYEPISVFQYGGLKGEKAAASYELFTSEVLPSLQKM